MTRSATPPRTAVRRLALGRLVSMTGTFAAGISLTYILFERTGSAAWVSATVLLTWGIPGFLGPFAGAIADRFDRRRLMIWSEVGAGVLWLALAFSTTSSAGMLAIAFLASVVLTPYLPASGAAIPNVAGPQRLAWANSLMAIGRYSALTLGPLVGGALVASVDPRWVFAANAVSFLISAGLTASVRADFADPERDAQAVDEHRGIAAGYRFVRADPVLRTVLLSFFVFILGMGMGLVADPVLSVDFGWGSFGFGLLTACWGAGTIVGAWLARGVRPEQEARWMIGFSALVAVCGFGIATAPWFGVVLFWNALFGITDGPTQVVEQNLLQRRTPDHVRSRVMGFYEASMHVALVIAMVAGGVVVPLVGSKGTYAVGGVFGLVGTALLLPLVRHLPSRKDVEVEPELA
jgi:MFS family permease